MVEYLDKTILDLVSLLVAAAGIFSVLVKFSVPQLNKMYLGHNPHGVKRDVIDGVTAWVFLTWAMVGVGIQAFATIKGESLPNKHTQDFYVWTFFIGLALIVLSTWLLGKIARVIARLFWKPRIGKLFAENLNYLHFMVGNENRFSEAYREEKAIREKAGEESIRRTNMESAKRMIADLEQLFEIKIKDQEWAGRLGALSGLIEPYYCEK